MRSRTRFQQLMLHHILLFLTYWLACGSCTSPEIQPLAAINNSQFSMMTWNIQDLGRSKDETELAVMVDVMKDFDLVLIQEVVAKDPAGAQAVAKIADELNRKGAAWDYTTSNPTNSPSSFISERYAFLWKPSRLKIVGEAFLDEALEDVCDREPYIAEFRLPQSQNSFFVVNFHARRFDNEPEEEIKHFGDYASRLSNNNIIIAGDFNLDEVHPVWDPFEQIGFQSAVKETPTTLKRACNDLGEYFNYPIDNIFYQSQAFILKESGRIDFVGECSALEKKRGVSDHLPVYGTFGFK